MHGRALAAVEHSELDSGSVNGQSHRAAQRVDFADDLPLAHAADGRIATHLGNRFDVAWSQARSSPPSVPPPAPPPRRHVRRRSPERRNRGNSSYQFCKAATTGRGAVDHVCKAATTGRGAKNRHPILFQHDTKPEKIPPRPMAAALQEKGIGPCSSAMTHIVPFNILHGVVPVRLVEHIGTPLSFAPHWS